MDGAAVIAAYHELWQVEASFRMTKSDLRARPVFHHEREAIELCVWAELDQQAAAVSLGVKVGTVKSRLHRARRRLATELGPAGGEPGHAPLPHREEQ